MLIITIYADSVRLETIDRSIDRYKHEKQETPPNRGLSYIFIYIFLFFFSIFPFLLFIRQTTLKKKGDRYRLIDRRVSFDNKHTIDG